MLFPEKLRLLRKHSGLRQCDVARRIGVDVPMLSRFEHGERHPKRQQVVKLAHLFKTDPHELVALWLASKALDEIGSDRMSSRAIELLGAEMGVKMAPLPIESLNTPAAAGPEPVRDIIAKLGDSHYAQYHEGMALEVLSHVETESVDCVLTTPPYWSLRRYSTESITAQNVSEFAAQIVSVMAELHRVLKPTGSLWLNMGDAYMDKSLQGLPWRVALQCIDQQGWILRNDVVWDKLVSAFDSSDNRLRSVHEYIFHMVKGDDFFYDDEQLRIAYNHIKNSRAKLGKNKTDTTGSHYKKRIMQSNALNAQEKENAIAELEKAVAMVNSGEIPDFRMTLREQEGQILDSKSEKARAINQKGYHLLLYNKHGGMPGDVWSIPAGNSPIDRYNILPDALCKLVIEATCPDSGIVLDPYCGLGTTCRVATELHRRAVGIDVNPLYIQQARQQAHNQLPSLF